MNKEIKILIADDHKIVREGLVSLLQNQSNFCFKIKEVANGAEVLNEMDKESFDIVLLDIYMPRIDGIRTLELLRHKNDLTPILILSFNTDRDIVQRVMLHGANGFISKCTAEEELIIAISKVCAGGSYLLDAKTDFNSHTTEGDLVSLTKRELQVISLIALEMSNNEIAEEMFISIRTVEFHKGNIMNKLHVKNNVGITKYAIKMGLIKWINL